MASASKKPLTGRRVVLTRSEGANENWADELTKRGASVLELPLVSVTLGASSAVSGEILDSLGTYEWIVFTSANGVKGFFKSFFEKYRDIRCLGPGRVACVGKATAVELDRFHIQTDVMPDDATGEALADALIAADNLENLKILLVAGNRSRDTVETKLVTEGQAIVDTFVVYETKEADAGEATDVEDFRENGADAVVFASPSAVESFVGQLARLKPRDGAKHPKVVAVGPVTAAAVKRHGIPLGAEAATPSAAGIADAVENLFAK